jgi:hypothetical protein
MKPYSTSQLLVGRAEGVRGDVVLNTITSSHYLEVQVPGCRVGGVGSLFHIRDVCTLNREPETGYPQ